MTAASQSPAGRVGDWLAGLIDYAGLFPPAALGMADATAEYAREVAGPDAWILGRFVLPSSRPGELVAARASLPDQLVVDAHRWRLSAVIGTSIDEGMGQVEAFNTSSHARHAVVDAVEVRADSVEAIDHIAARVGRLVETYIEVPLGGSTVELLDRIATHGLCAKVRTGGVNADAFPSSEDLSSFLAAAVRAGVRFKATAGLHHPLRGEYRLTYADDAECGTMHGYLNVLLATAALKAGWSGADVERLLVSRDPSALAFVDGGVGWRDAFFSSDALRAARAEYLLSVGSCSFREPVDEIQAVASQAS